MDDAPSLGLGAYNYVVTAHKPTSVSASVVGNFTGAADLNLLISKSTRLEIHKLTPEGLQGVLDVPIFGRISVLKLFRPQGETTDLLFLMTERYKFCVLQYDATSGELVTRANGDASEKVGRPCEAGQLGIVDPECRVIGLHLYDGHLKIIPIGDDCSLHEAFNVRLEELKVIDLAFLHECASPTIAVLYEDTKEQRHIKTYEIIVRDKDLIEGPWAEPSLDPGSSMAIPIRNTNGAVVIGEQTAVFLSSNPPCSCSISPTIMKTHGEVGEHGSRFLLGDYTGKLSLLVLEKEHDRVVSLKIETLGHTSQASTLSYLDSGVVFVGSSFADSQLVRLHNELPDPAKPGQYVKVLDTITNLGPIVDFCVVDLDHQGQGQVVTCSGGGIDGSLRIVRNGIGVLEQAAIELPGIKGVWSLRKTFMDVYDTYLVLSFVGETRVLGLNEDDELDEADIEGFDAQVQTLWCSNVEHNQFLQVSSRSVRLIDCTTKQVAGEWRPADGSLIVVAAGSATQVVVAEGGGRVAYLDIVDHGLVHRGDLSLDAEISCLDISPVGGDPHRANLLAIGTWTMQVHVYSLPQLTLITSEAVGGEVMPRSVLFSIFEGVPYLLCGLGDGHLVTYRLQDGLTDMRKLALGTKPITLKSFRSRDMTHVFAASDRPTVIYGSNNKLLFSNLNENEVNFMASFNTESFPDSLAIVKEENMAIGSIDDVQKLHIKAVPLQEQPRRIAHQESSRTFAVTTTQATTSLGSQEATDSVRLLDDQTFETVDVWKLGNHEMACSISSLTFANDPTQYYIVGTAFVLPEEMEPSKGRILVFSVNQASLSLVSEKETRGAVYNVSAFQGKLLAGINGRVQLYQREQQDDGTFQLVPECSHAGHVLALFVETRGDFIIVGDLMKSMQLLVYKPEENTLELRARDYNPAWMCAVTILDDDTYLGAENNYNLFAVGRNSAAANDEERARLEVVGQFHLGEFVNRFRHGSLVMKLPDSELSKIPTILFGTISGVIGVIASLPREQYDILLTLETAMRKVVKGVGGLDHAEWRSFSTPFVSPGAGNVIPSRGFLDGDLIEQYLDLKRASMEAVVAEIGGQASVDSVLRLVEELARLH